MKHLSIGFCILSLVTIGVVVCFPIEDGPVNSVPFPLQNTTNGSSVSPAVPSQNSTNNTTVMSYVVENGTIIASSVPFNSSSIFNTVHNVTTINGTVLPPFNGNITSILQFLTLPNNSSYNATVSEGEERKPKLLELLLLRSLLLGGLNPALGLGLNPYAGCYLPAPGPSYRLNPLCLG